MVVSTAKQLQNTYRLWQRFSFSTENRSWDTIAVPSWVGDKLNSAFTVIISMALVQFWTIVPSVIFYFALRRYKNDSTRLDPLAVTLWNKRGDLVNSVTEMIGFRGGGLDTAMASRLPLYRGHGWRCENCYNNRRSAAHHPRSRGAGKPSGRLRP